MSPVLAQIRMLLNAYRKVARLSRIASSNPFRRLQIRVAARFLRASYDELMDQTLRLVLLDGLEPKKKGFFSRKGTLRGLSQARKYLAKRFRGVDPAWLDLWTGKKQSGLFRKMKGAATRLTRTTAERGFGPEDLLHEFIAYNPKEGNLHPWVRAAAGKHEVVPGIGPEVEPVRYAPLAKAIMSRIQMAKYKLMTTKVEEVDPETGQVITRSKWREELAKDEGTEPSDAFIPSENPETKWMTPMTQDTWDMSEFMTQAIMGDLNVSGGVAGGTLNPSDRAFKQGPGAKVWDFLQHQMKRNLKPGPGWEARSEFMSKFLAGMQAGNDYAMIEAIEAGEKARMKEVLDKRGIRKRVRVHPQFNWEKLPPRQQTQILENYHDIVQRAAAAARAAFVKAMDDPTSREEEELQAAAEDLRTQAEVLHTFKRVRGDDILDPDVIEERENYLDFLMKVEAGLKRGEDFNRSVDKAVREITSAGGNAKRARESYVSKLRGDRKIMKDFLFLSQYNQNIGEGMTPLKAERAAIAKVEGIVLLTDEAKDKYATFLDTYRRRLKAKATPERAFAVAIQRAEKRRGALSDTVAKYRGFLDVFQTKVDKEKAKEPTKRRSLEQILRESAAKAEGVKPLTKAMKEHYSDFRQAPTTDRRQKMVTRYQERATAQQMGVFYPLFKDKLGEGYPWNEAIDEALGEMIPGWDDKGPYQKRNLRTKYVEGLKMDPVRERKLSLLANYKQTLDSEELAGLGTRQRKSEAFNLALQRTVGEKASRNPRIVQEYSQFLRDALQT